jgi:hypothetical protein
VVLEQPKNYIITGDITTDFAEKIPSTAVSIPVSQDQISDDYRE